MTPAVLALLALALSGPVPSVMARMALLHRTPRAAVALWQAVAVAAVLAALGATLSLLTAQVYARESDVVRMVVGVGALLVTVVVCGRLLLSGHRVGTRLRALRRRHRELVDALAAERDGVRVLEHSTPMAYCLPALRDSRVVVSAATYATLTVDEVDAVVAHERAHLRARHDLVLEAFTVLHRAFPSGVSSSAALGEVRLLVELLADRAAERAVGAKPLGRALVAIAGGRVPDVALGAGGPAVLIRLDRLRDRRTHRVQAVVVLLAAAAVLLLPTLLVAVPWLASLA